MVRGRTRAAGLAASQVRVDTSILLKKGCEFVCCGKRLAGGGVVGIVVAVGIPSTSGGLGHLVAWGWGKG